MAFIPVKRIPSIVEESLATVSVTKGDLMYRTTAGYVTATSTALATSIAGLRPVCVAAETVDGTALSLGSTKILTWPATPDVGWEALTSSASTLAMKDARWDVDKNSVQNETTTAGGVFIIDELVDKEGNASSATVLKCIGRIVSPMYVGSVT